MTAIPVQPPDPDALPDLAVLEVVRDLLDEAHAVADVPAFGSPTWLALDRDDPRWLASLVRAAVASWGAGCGLAAPIAVDRLHRQHAADLAVALASAAGPDQQYLDEGGALAAAVARRQARLDDARRLRVGDFLGGRVEEWGPTTKGSAA